MSAETYLLDSSAMLTMIEGETGAERVRELIAAAEVLLPWLVLLEVHYISEQERGRVEADARHVLIKQIPVEILWEVDEPTLLTAAQLKASHRISLADSLVAAYAIRQQATLVHKDPEFEALAGQVSLEALPYKTASLSGG